MGSDAAIEAADIVLMDDKPSKIATAIRISQRTLRIVHQNIVFALVVKGIVLLLGALGISGMWEAVFADVGVSVIAILNAMRALKTNGRDVQLRAAAARRRRAFPESWDRSFAPMGNIAYRREVLPCLA